MSGVTGRLENWIIGASTGTEFIIWGELYDDTRNRWYEGTLIHTSVIQQRDVAEGDTVVTRNGSYLLGVPAPRTTTLAFNDDGVTLIHETPK